MYFFSLLFGTLVLFYRKNSKYVSTKASSSISFEIQTNLNYLVNPICGWKSLVKSIRPISKIEIHSLRIYKCGLSTTKFIGFRSSRQFFSHLLLPIRLTEITCIVMSSRTCHVMTRNIIVELDRFELRMKSVDIKVRMQTKSKEKNSKLICQLSNVLSIWYGFWVLISIELEYRYCT